MEAYAAAKAAFSKNKLPTISPSSTLTIRQHAVRANEAESFLV